MNRRIAALFLAGFLLGTPIYQPALAQDGEEGSPPMDSSAVALPNQGVAPIRIAIPSLGLDTEVVPVGTDQSGAMAAPDDPDTVAWYSLGPGLAPIGNVVLAGHLDWDGQIRAFGRLQSLSEGDEITLWDETGVSFRYLVESSDWVDASGASVEDIFGQSLESRITLITCGGLFDPFHGQYLQRLVVRAHATTG